MSLVWQYYHLTVAQSFVPSQVLVVVHAQFRKLPWESFFPTIDVLRSMVEVGSIYTGNMNLLPLWWW